MVARLEIAFQAEDANVRKVLKSWEQSMVGKWCSGMAGTRSKLGPGVRWDELESCYTESRLVRERIRREPQGTATQKG